MTLEGSAFVHNVCGFLTAQVLLLEVPQLKDICPQQNAAMHNYRRKGDWSKEAVEVPYLSVSQFVNYWSKEAANVPCLSVWDLHLCFSFSVRMYTRASPMLLSSS